MLRALVAGLIGLVVAFGLASSLPAQPPGRPAERPITFVIHVPAEAQIEIEGVKTSKTGETREFKTPDIVVGRKYSYAVKITFQGKTTSHQLTLTHAGPNVFDLRRELTAPKPATPAAPGGPSFTLFSPSTVTIPAGDAGPFAVKIKREGINGAVELSFRGLPAGVRINDATIPAGKEEQSVLALTEATARPGTSVVEVLAKSGRVQKQANFRLTITAAGAAPPAPPVPSKEPAKKDAKPKPPPDDLPPAEPPPMPPGSDAKKPPGERKKPG